MQLTQELASERTRSHLELAEEIRCARRLRALSRARRAERKAERRMVEAWRTRDALEASFNSEYSPIGME
jgi:quinol monooxygenase YgiN